MYTYGIRPKFENLEPDEQSCTNKRPEQIVKKLFSICLTGFYSPNDNF
tara:strand:- start:322 stop:465 length:144 start_codon:yes stop_codon:yes gene_type:complete